MTIKHLINKTYKILILVATITSFIYLNHSNQNEQKSTTVNNLTEKVSLCFTPSMNCENLILNHIRNSKNTIYLQAYSFTAPKIINELIQAHKRGVKVKILLDSSNLKSKNSGIYEIKKHGIKVKIDKIRGIAHNKIIIIDNTTVITGSYNFSVAANKNNAENIIILHDKKIADLYIKNWYSRSKVSFRE